jgi:hypothetical protein
MNIQQLIEKDPRVIELRQQYQQTLAKKNQMIMAISNIEADIIKMMGKYEVISNEIVTALRKGGIVSDNPSPTDTVPADVVPSEGPEPTDPGDESPVAEENQDDGFADAKVEDKAPEIIPPTAENTNPAGSQE